MGLHIKNYIIHADSYFFNNIVQYNQQIINKKHMQLETITLKCLRLQNFHNKTPSVSRK